MIHLLIPVLLFVCGWDVWWWQAWVYSMLILGFGLGGRLWAEHRHPGLLAERAKFGTASDTKPWDRVLSPLMAVSVSFPLVIVAGFDHRFGWSSAFPLWVIILGFLLIAVGYGFSVWALMENKFFSGVVRIQTDRGHTVCDTGPYRLVRHPGYAGNIVPLFGMVLAFSSAWTLLPAVFAFIVTVIRTVLEDQTLQAELSGYKEYAQCVRYRLIPGLF